MSVPRGVKTSSVWAMRMGCDESLARLKIATIEKMNARVQMKTEPRIAPLKQGPYRNHIMMHRHGLEFVRRRPPLHLVVSSQFCYRSWACGPFPWNIRRVL